MQIALYCNSKFIERFEHFERFRTKRSTFRLQRVLTRTENFIFLLTKPFFIASRLPNNRVEASRFGRGTDWLRSVHASCSKQNCTAYQEAIVLGCLVSRHIVHLCVYFFTMWSTTNEIVCLIWYMIGCVYVPDEVWSYWQNPSLHSPSFLTLFQQLSNVFDESSFFHK